MKVSTVRPLDLIQKEKEPLPTPKAVASGLPQAATASGLPAAAAASAVKDQKKQLEPKKKDWSENIEDTKRKRLEKIANIQQKDL